MAIYESDHHPRLITWDLSDAAVAGARNLGHVSPQTLETTLP